MIFDTPVLFLVFNRPSTTQRVFEAIKKIKPAKLFIAADGPRTNRAGEAERCEEVRRIVSEINWKCDVQTLFRNHNQGCGKAVSSAISWFFDHVEQGIILEDDTLPNNDFFQFCHNMLELYKDDASVMHVSGSNYASPDQVKGSHFFSKIPFIWGWATWRRAWKSYEFQNKYLSIAQKEEILKRNFTNQEIIHHWSATLQSFHLSPASYTWDFQWFLSIWKNDGLVVQPKVNLVQNIGFSADATHTKDANHHLGLVLAASLGEITTTVAKKIDLELQDANFHYYFQYDPTRNVQPRVSFFRKIKSFIGKIIYVFLHNYNHSLFESKESESKRLLRNAVFSEKVKLNPDFLLCDVSIGDFTYIAPNAIIHRTTIGKFCSIGTNLICGYGIHPLNGISTSPMFYSTMMQNGYSLSDTNKAVEQKPITIENDVFIGMNVTILDGVKIGNGAVIGAGTVVSKDVPPYAIVVGSPMRIIKYRFDEFTIAKLLKIKWWELPDEELWRVEEMFADVQGFVAKYEL